MNPGLLVWQTVGSDITCSIVLKKQYFIYIYLWSTAKQVIQTYMNHSQPLIPNGIHLIFLKRFERRGKPCAEHLARKHLVLFL